MRCAKIILSLFITAAACLLLALSPARLCFGEGKSYTFYCGSNSSDCKIITVNGNAALYRLALKNVCGESTTYAALDITEFLSSLNGKIIFTEELTDSVNYYCTADLPYKVTLYNAQINLHVCVKQTCVTVASPIIFGGY